MTTPSDLAARLARLERQHQQFRRLALGALCLLPVGLGAFAASRRAPVVVADRVELVSASGAHQAVLSADSAGVNLTLLDTKGRPASAIRLGKDSTLTLLDAAGRRVAVLGGPQVRQLQQ
jgi:hypothetical protein